jgi:hypothetical protein
MVAHCPAASVISCPCNIPGNPVSTEMVDRNQTPGFPDFDAFLDPSVTICRGFFRNLYIVMMQLCGFSDTAALEKAHQNIQYRHLRSLPSNYH